MAQRHCRATRQAQPFSQAASTAFAAVRLVGSWAKASLQRRAPSQALSSATRLKLARKHVPPALTRSPDWMRACEMMMMMVVVVVVASVSS